MWKADSVCFQSAVKYHHHVSHKGDVAGRPNCTFPSFLLGSRSRGKKQKTKQKKKKPKNKKPQSDQWKNESWRAPE